MSDAPPLKLSMAGLGVAATMALPGVEQYENAVIAAADPRQSARDAFLERYGGQVYEGVEGLCADADVDVIWIATPNHQHQDHAVMAAKQGKHSICTRPMAFDGRGMSRDVRRGG